MPPKKKESAVATRTSTRLKKGDAADEASAMPAPPAKKPAKSKAIKAVTAPKKTSAPKKTPAPKVASKAASPLPRPSPTPFVLSSSPVPTPNKRKLEDLDMPLNIGGFKKPKTSVKPAKIEQPKPHVPKVQAPKKAPPPLPPKKDTTELWYDSIASSDTYDELQIEQISSWMEEGLNISLESSAFYVLGWKMGCQQITSISRETWIMAMKKLDVKNNAELSRYIKAELTKIEPNPSAPEFSAFYKAAFNFLKMTSDSKSLGVDEACALMATILNPDTYSVSYTSTNPGSSKRSKMSNPFPHAEPFVAFLSQDPPPVRVINKDQWNSFLAFNASIGSNCQGYSEEGAWPGLYDQYMSWKKAIDGVLACPDAATEKYNDTSPVGLSNESS